MRQKKCWFRISRIAAVFTMILVLLTEAVAASTYKVLHRFTRKDGATPLSVLIFDAAGNLYGTTHAGGNGYGVVFKLAPNVDGTWTESLLHRFKGGADGAFPRAGLIFDAAGNLYGTTYTGGNGYGVVFKLAPNVDGTWTESVLHSFCSVTNFTDGAAPQTSLIFDVGGNLYGTTSGGGGQGSGVVFRLKPNGDGTWTESVLYTLCSVTNCADGAGPPASLIFDVGGNLYGTTNGGGTRGKGVVFKLTPNSGGSWTESIVHYFTGPDGAYPKAGLIFDEAGNLYGTTPAGGGKGSGVVFKLKPNGDGSWTESVLHSFADNPADNPQAGLIFDVAGNLYGTTVNGGLANAGVVFEMTPQSNGSWAFSVPHVFVGKPALVPYAGVVLDKAGNLYGTTYACGSGMGCYGVVYEVTP